MGQKLPPERELATLFQVSRTSIREALRLLEINGVIEISPGDGTYIRQMEMKTLVSELAAAINNIEDNLIFEMLEFRLLIETECAALAAYRASSTDIEQMHKYLRDTHLYLNNEDLSLLADLNFHRAVAQASNNSILANLMQTLGDNMKNCIRATHRHHLSIDGDRLESVTDHEHIFKAILSKDSEQARQRMKAHIMRFRQLMANLPLKY
jgi:DNA-binding FadR family transcriptional regulator